MSRYLRKKASQCKADFVGKGNKRIYFKVLSPSGETHDVSLQFECSPCQYTAYEGARDLKICGHILAVCDAISKMDGDMERIKGIEGEKVLDVDMEGTKECECSYCNEKKHCHRITGRFGEHMCCRECLKEEFNMEVQDGGDAGQPQEGAIEGSDNGIKEHDMAENDEGIAQGLPGDEQSDRQED